jgi:hypothetical protein
MKQALEALEKVITAFGPGLTLQQKAATALRQALVDADDTSQERVDEIVKDEHDKQVTIAQAYERGWNAALAQQEPVAWADAIIDDLQGLFDTDGITEQDSGDALIRLSDAIAAVEDEKKRYTAPPKQEPVAYANSFDLQNFDMKVRTCPDLHHTVPLYTAPPKREWVGLTKEDMPDGDNPMFDTDEFYAGMVWAEAKLKEKNA